MKAKNIFLLAVIMSSFLFASDKAMMQQLHNLQDRLLFFENQALTSHSKIARLRQDIAGVKQELKGLASGGALINSIQNDRLSDDFELLDLRMYEWTDSSDRLVARIRCTTLTFAEWVKLYFYFYRDGQLIADDYSYIDYETYGYSGVLPFHQSYIETFVDKTDFDSLQVAIDYDKESGDDAFLCDQILQHVANNLTSSYSSYVWEGVVNNASTYSLEFPKIHANIIRKDSLIDVDYTYLDTECQGGRTVIIDYVIDSPPEAQEIVLRNCSKEAVDLSGWRLGDKDSPYAYTIPYGDSIAGEGYKSYTNDDINFTIDTEDEIIYLSDADKNLVDQWTKDENDNILYPLTSSCYNSYLSLPESYDKIKYKFSYSLHSLLGEGDITPNAPVFTEIHYSLAPGAEHEFHLFLIDANEDPVELQIDWGDGGRTGWLGPFASRALASAPHAYHIEGDFWASARSRDGDGATSAWGDSVHVFVSSTVPVELADFTAILSAEHVVLRWRTLSETNNLGFVVERSGDKIEWRKAGFVNGHGTTARAHEYTFMDALRGNGTTFYRLRQIDFDGSQHFSEIIEIKQSRPTLFELASVHPNPFNTSTQIAFKLAADASVDIDVFDINGRRIVTLLNGHRRAGEHKIIWHAESVPSGSYFIRMQTAHNVQFLKCLLLK